MELTLNNSVQIIAIVSFAAALAKYLIVVPLQTAILALQRSIEKMEQTLSSMQEEQTSMDKRLVAVEASAKSAHKRIDGLEA